MAAQVEDNLGYVMMCTNRLDEGIRSCEAARAILEEMGAEHYLYEVLQDLCYGYVLADELDHALSSGERALELAIEHNDQQIAKNCLFLLSEIAVRRGDTFGARRYLHELTAYYPEAGISEEIIDVFKAVRAVVDEREPPTFFEMTTAMALNLFAEKGVDWAILEVGMGGRLDATNVVQPQLTIINNVSFDHQEFLGSTLSQIAREKAGIIKKQVPLITAVKQMVSSI